MNTPRRSFCILIFALIPALLHAATDPAAETEVRRADAARVTALLQGDISSLERLYSDQLTYIHSNGRIDTKAGYLRMLSTGDLTYVSLSYEGPVQVRTIGDTAVVTGRANIEARNKAGQITKRVLTTTTVYVRSGKAWTVISYQGTPAT
jgi:ketosteroid isomerase-like protein